MLARLSAAINNTMPDIASRLAPTMATGASEFGLVEMLNRDAGWMTSSWASFSAGKADSIARLTVSSPGAAASMLRPSRNRPYTMSV